MCSDEDSLKDEIQKLSDIFRKNGYSDEFFQRTVREYLEKRANEVKKTRASSPEKGVKEEILHRPWIQVPYIGKASILFSRRLTKLIKDRLDKDIRTIFQTTKVKDSFALKDTTPKEICARVVYMFSCRGDPTVNYIGYTNRTLGERVKEHLRGGTAVSDHIAYCSRCTSSRITIDDFRVLRKCHTKLDTAIYEAILIKSHNPKLNTQLVKPGYSYTLKIFN